MTSPLQAWGNEKAAQQRAAAGRSSWLRGSSSQPLKRAWSRTSGGTNAFKACHGSTYALVA
jgi:hypothetical protein